MTEEEWLASRNVFEMMQFLRYAQLGPAGEARSRKYRLLGCACVRQVADLSDDELSRNFLDIAERFADRQLKRKDHAIVEARAGGVPRVVRWTLYRSATIGGIRIAEAFGHGWTDLVLPVIRDIFGNPFRPVMLPAECHTPSIVALAQAAYAQRTLPGGALNPLRLAALADALAEQGGGAEIINHLREHRRHVRGCHAIDSLMGLG